MTTTTKAAFEVWAKDRGNDTAHTYDTERSRWAWLNPMTADLWESWTASRAAALEEAAQAVEALDCAHRCGVGSEIASAIRAREAVERIKQERK